jgi:hypothetical protein
VGGVDSGGGGENVILLKDGQTSPARHSGNGSTQVKMMEWVKVTTRDKG